MNAKKIAITTTSFAQFDEQPLRLLQGKGFELAFNRRGRVLNPQEIPRLLEDCEGVIAGTEIYTTDILGALKNLQVISRCGSGLDNIDVESCKKLNIQVYTTSDGPALAVAELVIGLMLNLLRHISLTDRAMRQGIWDKKMGSLFAGKEVGIVGLGKIGKEVARLSTALGAGISFFDPYEEGKATPKYKRLTLPQLLRTADIVTLHVDRTEQTLNLIGDKELSLMKKEALLINCSRGGIVDERVLYENLKMNKIAGAGIDVFQAEPYQGNLKELDNVILTSHIGSYAKEIRAKMELTAVENLIKGLGGN